jgi:hypothetical protein
LEIVPEGEFDELWIAACSPSGITELCKALTEHRRRERLVIVTPGVELPAGRWSMDWATLERTIEIGRRDMIEAIEKALSTNGNVVHGMRVEEIKKALK